FALSVVLHAGLDTYKAFLKGGQGIDQHVATQPLVSNAPLLLGLLDVWYRNSWQFSSQAVLPYDHRLKLLPNYLQQLLMESAGKSVSSDGSPLERNSGGVIWGTEGSNGQHSFHQLLHQGSDTIPCDFIVAMSSPCQQKEQHQALVANCLSQSLVLMRGQSEEDIHSQLLAEGTPPVEAELLARHKAMPGNRPSTTITMTALTAESLGALIALYEYRLLTQSFVWGINPFDQWGVERGKKISGKILKAMNTGADENLDGSSKLLLSRYREQLHSEANN
ncbi:MAG: glucose-6-phosphate isomerase, partial [Spongiibacteraceae bacterium]